MTNVEDVWKSLQDILSEELAILNPKKQNLASDVAIGLNIYVNNKKVRTSMFDQSGNRKWEQETQKETAEVDEHKV